MKKILVLIVVLAMPISKDRVINIDDKVTNLYCLYNQQSSKNTYIIKLSLVGIQNSSIINYKYLQSKGQP